MNRNSKITKMPVNNVPAKVEPKFPELFTDEASNFAEGSGFAVKIQHCLKALPCKKRFNGRGVCDGIDPPCVPPKNPLVIKHINQQIHGRGGAVGIILFVDTFHHFHKGVFGKPLCADNADCVKKPPDTLSVKLLCIYNSWNGLRTG